MGLISSQKEIMMDEKDIKNIYGAFGSDSSRSMSDPDLSESESLTKILKEKEEIDKSIERLEHSIGKLKDKNRIRHKGSKKKYQYSASHRVAVPKLNFKKLMKQKLNLKK